VDPSTCSSDLVLRGNCEIFSKYSTLAYSQ
jgi:hypothetical protein